jgi:hypothetical protein
MPPPHTHITQSVLNARSAVLHPSLTWLPPESYTSGLYHPFSSVVLLGPCSLTVGPEDLRSLSAETPLKAAFCGPTTVCWGAALQSLPSSHTPEFCRQGNKIERCHMTSLRPHKSKARTGSQVDLSFSILLDCCNKIP